MATKNPREIQVGAPSPCLIAQALGTTGTALTADPGATITYLVKQIILTNLGAAANVVHLYHDTTTTVSSAERFIEVSVPADSYVILYMNKRIANTEELYGNATNANEVNVVIIADAEAV
jgi:hypothetical protein